ncbi:PepSY domain-containing protein [Pseudomonas chlororaphis]|uniref:PepSY domain-containing protein n=1 Tax=Pseudomonas chlororaphis TaxID=587753 RepID=UPI000F566994|nr:PepSY domain-containing protein [Pseudomonas chlororaphis]AZE06142.1 putative lipoprotein [Pseudomonas chlororaphis subsp. aureofaciens]MBP5065795.1 PepSY domain-containing protein [Pseudomonas chlororaphis]QTT95506.1 PepSY domain-containing protein [Pseudomonas chlororaphis]
MKTLTALFTTTLIGMTASLAHARDLGPDEALRLRDAGTIVSFEKLNATALAKHPGATITETELEEEYGKYIYQVEMRDPQGVEWDLELDAVSGQVLKDHQDT